MPNLPSLSESDYDAIESAVMETARGRWFLAEFARRNRHADTTMLLKALERIESAVSGERTVAPVDQIRFDLVEMAKAIARTKAEIAAIKPDAQQQGKFAEASEQLDSVVQATEDATSEILACAEHIQELAWTMREQGMAPELCDLIDAKATEVYTACSFQDLTGQRTRKVIGVLRYLEDRINAMIEIWGLEGVAAPEPEAADNVTLLNGPAKPGQGLAQSDVDLVMGIPVQVGPLGSYEHLSILDGDDSMIEPEPPPGVWAGLTVVRAPDVAPAEGEPAAPEPAPAREPPAREPRPAADPLAPIVALSAEEKIALFS